MERHLGGFFIFCNKFEKPYICPEQNKFTMHNTTTNEQKQIQAIEGNEYHGSAFRVFGSPLKGAGDIYVTVSHVSEHINVRDKRVVYFRLNRRTAHKVPTFFSMLEADFLTEFEPAQKN